MMRRVPQHFAEKPVFIVGTDFFHWPTVVVVLVVGGLAVDIGLVLFVKVRPGFPFVVASASAKQALHAGGLFIAAAAVIGKVGVTNLAFEYHLSKRFHGDIVVCDLVRAGVYCTVVLCETGWSRRVVVVSFCLALS